MILRFRAILAIAVSLAALACVAFALRPQESQAPKSIEGTWEGTLGGKLHLLITFSKAGDATFVGTLNSLDQHAILTIESATQQGDSIQFEVRRVGGNYKGKLTKNGDEILGDWTQSAAPNPQTLNLKRKPAEQKDESPSSQAQAPAKSAQSERRIPTPKPFSAPLDVTVPAAPWAFHAAGKWHLAYELHIANLGRFDCQLTRIEAIATPASSAAPRKSFVAYSAADLAGILYHPGAPDSSDLFTIAPGAVAIAYLWITVDSRDAVPASLVHLITIRIGDYPEGFQIDTPPLEVIRRPVVVIAPPLRGPDWAAINGPSNTSLHRRALIPVNGRSYISQRFATDWVQLTRDGDTHTGDPADNKNYRAYGAEVFAVADGTITEVKDSLPQNIPGLNSRAIPITLETVGGNHIIQQIGDHLFAFYAHLQPNSLRVKVGDKVKQGQLLGLLGNSGNSTEPHLHFDICDASSMLACEGVPFAFTSYGLEGYARPFKPGSTGCFSTWVGKPCLGNHDHELPLEFDVVRFPGMDFVRQQ